ncbi:MAG: hypothetical protein JNG85_00940 [Spirochaetaceae bacterium]|nr:hypothetical protein [Spirochaetaceae bacterium]
MQRKPLYLAISAAEILRFLGLAFLAGSLGALGTGAEPSGTAALSSLFRYVAAPQLLFGAAFFFLWYDRGRYAPFRPLALVGKILALAAILPVFYAAFRLGPDLLPDRRAAFLPAAAVLLVDLVGLAALIADRTPADEASDRAGTGGPAAPKADNAPTGPDDIERVEA